MRIDLYDKTGLLVGYAVKLKSNEYLLYDKKGKFIAKVNGKTRVKQAIDLILATLPYIR